MTAQEIRSTFQLIEPKPDSVTQFEPFYHITPDMLNAYVEQSAKEYALQIADKAVDDRIKFYTELMDEETADEDGQEDQIMIWTAKIFAVKDILYQIKTLIEETK
jgi:hypothetical protein